MDTIFDTSHTYRTAEQLNTAMSRVYGYMSIAVLVSMLVSMFVGMTPELVQFFFTGFMKWVVLFAPLLYIFFVPALLESSKSAVTGLLVLGSFSGLMGLSFAVIFAVYTLGSIFTAFMGASVLFAVMSGYGYFTKRSLESVGQFMFIGLIAIIIASVINVFIGSTIMQMVISALAIIIFLGLTAYDTQQIREDLSYNTGHVAEIQGALTLYLDFINIFLNLLQLFGERK